MIDLSTHIRAFILADSELTDDLSTYYGAKSVFTRRPVPQDAEYPIIVISPQIGSGEFDYIDRLHRTANYDIAVYAQNDTSAHYRECEETAFLLQSKFARLTNAEFNTPAEWHLVQATATGPTPFPTDDNEKVARGVTVTFQLMKETA